MVIFSIFLCDVFTVHCVFAVLFFRYLAYLATIEYTYMHTYVISK